MSYEPWLRQRPLPRWQELNVAETGGLILQGCYHRVRAGEGVRAGYSDGRAELSRVGSFHFGNRR
jgi:hypothetical protein